VDAAFYTFPTEAGLTSLAELVPADFRFAFKVTDEITVKRFPGLPRFGPRAGQENPNFLNAELFSASFLTPLQSIRPHAGPLIFEFSHFHDHEFARGRDFIASLDGFLSRLPGGWQYAVEVRNRTFLHPEYFAMLRSHGVAHCFNSWDRMPPVGEQLEQEESLTADFTAARFLLTPGRNYQAAVDAFSPYSETRAPDPEARSACRQLITFGLQRQRNGAWIYINNRLEGNALATIRAVIESFAPPDDPQADAPLELFPPPA
jgi:uncharacterized protein YecE (DUF72 family)